MPFTSELEWQRVLVAWNMTHVDYPGNVCLHELCEAQAARTPDAVALILEDHIVTYENLDRRANQLAHYLYKLGVEPDMHVGICIERSLEMVIGLLAVMKAGGAYVPLDPSYPLERLIFMAQDARICILLTTQQMPLHAAIPLAHVVYLDTQWAPLAQESPEKLSIDVLQEHLAYTIYTSGSTGKPKGVMNTHRAICNRLLWMQDRFVASATDRILQKTSFSFDVSVWEFFWPLLCGATLVIARPGGQQNSAYLLHLIDELHITILHFVPTMLRAFLDEPEVENCSSLRLVMCSGEALPFDVQERFHARLAADLHNLYGPTEAAVDVTHWACERQSDLCIVPIGQPIANIRIYLLDPDLRLIPPGEVGEMYIGGVGLARGYLHRPDLTAERFVPDPFGSEAGSRLYRTGDMARYLADGTIEYRGRADFQVKIRGNRIELGEIEATLAQHVVVKACIVLMREDRPGNKRLVAYIVAREGIHWPTTNEWRALLKQKLPEYMLPSAFVQLFALPLLPNGKIDRSLLPAPRDERPDQDQAFVAPRNLVEQQLTQIWQEVLQVEGIGIHDNFFALGGDSILGLQVIARAHPLGFHFTTDSLFEYQTIAELGAALEVIAAESPLFASEYAQHGPLPLTPIQCWFFAHEIVERHHWNQSILVDIPNSWSVPLLQQAIQHIVELHEAFRLRFVLTSQGWQAYLAPTIGVIPFTQVNLTGLSLATQQACLLDQATQVQRSLHLEQGPLLAAAVFIAHVEQPYRLLLVAHHLVIDGVSWHIILDDLYQAYKQLAQGDTLHLVPEHTSWSHWTRTLVSVAQTPEIAAQLPFWELMCRQPAPSLPLDYPGDCNQMHQARTIQVGLTEQETQTLLRHVPKVYRIHAYELLLTALAQTLTDWWNTDEVVINVEGHGREEIQEGIDVSRTVGWFTSLYPIRLQATTQDQEGRALKQVKERLRGIPGRGIGYGLLRYACEQAAIREGLQAVERAEVVFNYLGQWEQAVLPGFGLPDAAMGTLRSPDSTRLHLLEIDAIVTAGRLVVNWTYSEQLHRRATIEHVATQFVDRLRHLMAYCCNSADAGYTPSDFELCSFTQTQLDRLLHRLQPGPNHIQDIYPLTMMQQGLLLQSQYGQEAGVYHVQMQMRIEHALDVQAFRLSWEYVMERHTVLRSSIYRDEETQETVQIVWRQVQLLWEWQDWRQEPWHIQQKRLQTYLREERQQGFALEQAPLWRLGIFCLGQQSYEVVWSFHHVILDGWSFALIVNEVADYYAGLTQGSVRQENASRPYREYVRWLNKQDLKSAEQYWREQLRGLQHATSLSVARQIDQSASMQKTVETHLEECIALTEQETAALVELGRAYQLTLSTIIQGMWALLLSRYSGEEDVVFGIVVSGRPGALQDVEKMTGLFINTLPLRLQMKRQAKGVVWLREVQEKSREMRQYEHSPLVQIQQWSEIEPGKPLFENVLIFENYPVKNSTAGPEPRILDVKDIRNIERTNYPLTFVVLPGPRLSLRLNAPSSYFEREALQAMLGHLHVLLQELVDDPQRSLAEFSLLTSREKQRILCEWNTTQQASRLYDRCFHQLFEEQAQRTPDRIALASGQEQLTYVALNVHANQFAHYLRRQGVRAETVVGICLERSFWLVISIVGIMKAGGAYLSLDPSYPQERLAFMLQDAQVALIISQKEVISHLSSLLDQSLCLDTAWAAIAQESEESACYEVDIQNLAYIIYTSGSLGKPKGVQVTHKGIGNMAMVHVEAFGRATTPDRVLQFFSFSFDASFYEMATTFLAGATLLLTSPQRLLPGTDLLQILEEEAVTTIALTPPILLAMPTKELPALRTILVGGQTCSSELVMRWATGRQFFNAYGPTEATVCASIARCIADGSRPTIGRPIAHSCIYILDRYLQPLPIGIAGEMYIGGIGLARGYHNRPDLTAAYFMPDPFSHDPGARLYKTGDSAYYRADGSIEFLGRLDAQIKLHGHRIELGEIEMTLMQHQSIYKAAVQQCEVTPGNKALVAYLVLKKTASFDAHDLRHFLASYLPNYMVPHFFMTLDTLPSTPNGKLDRRALPVPELSNTVLREEPVKPRNPVEETLVQTWLQILSHPHIGIHDNFFTLGGHSLLAGQLISRVRRAFQVELSLRQIFEMPTIAELAAWIAHAPDQERARRMTRPISRRKVASVSATSSTD